MEQRPQGVRVVDDLEFLSLAVDRSRIVGVTGTNGKTSTCLALAAALAAAGRSHALTGHLAADDLAVSIPRLLRSSAQGQSDSVLICEMACHQTELSSQSPPGIGVLTNIMPAVPARYETFEDYWAAKWRMLHRVQVLVAEIDHLKLADLSPAHAGISMLIGDSLESDVRIDSQSVTCPGFRFKFPAVSGMCSFPEGWRSAVGATVGVFMALGIRPTERAVQAACHSLGRTPHRLQRLGSSRGISFWNDSKATNVLAVRSSLAALEPEVILITGGAERGHSYSELPLHCVRRILAMGANATRISHELRERVVVVETLEGAFAWLRVNARFGDQVLLSPGTTSEDQFRNYRERGSVFQNLAASFLASP